jgi:acyl transferase domain-containing protein/aryl carrier-like protein
MNKKRTPTGFEIAVIGMSGRFPQARDIDEFWDNLKNGAEAVSFLSDEELEEAGISAQLLKNPDYVKARGGVLSKKECFDASFFGYTPAEAEVTDPQFRVFHECAHSALETAGYDPASYPGRIGLYAGFSSNLNWKALTIFSGKNLRLGNFAADQLTDKDFFATRIAYKLNLKGPAVAVQTACSTSLVAIHIACRALLMKECDIAMAGGISISSEVNTGYLYQEGMIASRDGHCRAFDERATGLVGGEGAGVVVLKRLKQALDDGDTIRAVVLGSAINNDGIRKVGYTAPSVEGQSEVIGLALHLAKVEAESIGYVETHGTGTVLGDPIEISALKQAFNTSKKGFCTIGSVKTNIGHLDAAAGVASFIKTVMALQNKQIPPSLHFEKHNPKIAFENSPFYVNTKLREWENNGYPLRAGVSSFGIGGTNAHVVLEEAPLLEPSSQSRKWQMLFLSAKTQTALNRATENLIEFLKKNTGINLADAAYTLQVGRAFYQYRKMVVCSNVDEALDALSSLVSENTKTFYSGTENRPIVFMFSGLGTEYVNMGLELYRTESIFREEINRCFEILKTIMDYDLKEILYPSNLHLHQQPDIKQFEAAQLILFVFEYALAKLLIKWGIEPQAMIGYSFGEYVAASIAGVLSLEEALKLVVFRGRLIQHLPRGAMLSVPLTKEQVKPLLNNLLSLAIDNGESCIIAGLEREIGAFEKKMKENHYMCMRLPNAYALHSKLMEPIKKDFLEKLRQIPLSEPKIPYISNVTGYWITAEQALDPGYWATHLQQTVRFSQGIKELLKMEGAVFLEVGPGRTLSSYVRQHENKTPDQFVLNLIRNPKEKFSDIHYLLRQMGRLWLYGIKINWSEFYAAEKKRRIPLPTYSFDDQSYWIEGNPFDIGARMLSESQTIKKTDVSDWFYIPSWQSSLSLLPENTDMGKRSCWLVFLDDCGVGSQLVKRLGKEGQDDIITVKKGKAFCKVKHGNYKLNPGDSCGYDALFKELKEEVKIPDKIAHLWSVTGDSTGKPGIAEIEVEDMDRAQDWGLYSLIYIAQAIGKQKIFKKIQIGVVTDHLHDVTGDEAVCPAKATIFGAVKVIPQEYPDISCCVIDVVLPGSRDSVDERFTNQLVNEFRKEFTGSVIALRNHRRLVQTFTPVKLGPHLELRAKLREKGVYLITGGLGNIGLVLAKHLAKKVKARLILTGRSYFPGRDQWQEYLRNHDEKNTLSRKIREIQEMEEQGARVLLLKADVSKHDQVQRTIIEGEKQFGPINGVIHAAGIIHDHQVFKSISESTKIQFLQQFKPKIYGLLVLEKVLCGKTLDFLLMTSSLSPILGGLGFSAYSAANSFLDSYAQYHNKGSSVPWISVNWEGWQFPSEQQKRENRESHSHHHLFITPDESVIAFQRVLACEGAHQIVISTGDLSARIDRWIKLEPHQSPAPGFGVESREGHHERPHLSTPYVSPGTELEQVMADTWQKFFGVKEVGIHDDFFELGGDSLKALQLVKLLKDSGIYITVDKIFLHTTIYKMCNHISRKEESIPQRDYGAVENYISRNYNTKAFYKIYLVNEKEYRILYIERENSNIEDILEGIKMKFKECYPNYIKLIESDREIVNSKEMDQESFSSMMSLAKQIPKQLEEKMLNELEKNQYLTQLLKKSKVARKYQISPIQRLWLSNRENISNKIIIFPYHFTVPVEPQEIKNIFTKIIRKHSLLRSTIVKVDDNYYIEEFRSFSNIELPFFDISNYSIDCKEEIQKILDKNLRKSFEVIDNLLYRVFVLKWDNSNYQLIFAFNHLIFDGESVLLLEEDIEKARKETHSDGYEEGKKVKIDYRDYSNFLNDLKYEDIVLEKYLNIPEYLEYVEALLRNEVKEMAIDLFDIDISILKTNYREFYNEILLLIYAKFISNLYKISKVPILFTSNGRNYKDCNFRNIIGDFHDDIPVLFSPDRGDYSYFNRFLETFIEYRQYIRDNNLNFLNFLLKKHNQGIDYWKILSTPFSFNSQIGLYDYNRDVSNDRLSEILEQENFSANNPKFHMGIYKDLQSGNIIVQFFTNSPVDITEIKDLFLKNYFDVVEYLNTEASMLEDKKVDRFKMDMRKENKN